MKPGHGEVLLAEGDRRVREDEEHLIEEFRRQLDEGMWAAVPTSDPSTGRREAQMVKEYTEIPLEAERVIFFPRVRRLTAVLLALLTLALVALLLAAPLVSRRARSGWRALARRRQLAGDPSRGFPYDPGRERRAEQRARELLRSCVNEQEWAMYRDLGFIRVCGRLAEIEDGEEAPYAYLIYPHKPIVAYVPSSGRLLSEYCVEFPDLTGTPGRSRLPASDDVLAKWMALTSNEARVIRRANMHLVGRQLDPARVRRDLWRLAEWEKRRPSTQPA